MPGRCGGGADHFPALKRNVSGTNAVQYKYIALAFAKSSPIPRVTPDHKASQLGVLVSSAAAAVSAVIAIAAAAAKYSYNLASEHAGSARSRVEEWRVMCVRV